MLSQNKDYPRLYRSLVMPMFRRRVSRISGLEKLPEKGPYLLAANHVGSFDPPVIVSTIHQRVHQLIYFVTEQFVVNFFGLRRAVESLGMIPKYEQRKSECLDHAREHLEKGHIVGIFIEGMRNDGPLLLKGRTGAARLALWTRVPVYPVGVIAPGTWSFLSTIKHWFSSRRPAIELHIGDPLTFPAHYGKPITYDMLREVTGKILEGISPLARKPYPYNNAYAME